MIYPGKFIISVSIFALVASGCGNNEPASEAKNIFGTDSRQELKTTTFPGSAVGRLDIGCTGSMIGKKLAITAAHCVVDVATGKLRTEVTSFKSGLKGASNVAESWIAAAWVGSLKPEAERKNDWAILLLNDDIGSRTGWFGLKPIDTSSQLPFTLNTAGYASDKDQGETPLVARNCYIHKVDDAGRLLHDCDGVTGISGGPMYVESGSSATIMAITAAEFRRGDQSMTVDAYSHQLANIGVAIDTLLMVVEKVKPSVDSGLSIPDVTDTIYLVNTGSNPGTGNGNGNNNGRPVDPQTALITKIKMESDNIVNEAGSVLYQLNIIQNYSSARGYTNLWNHAATLRTATEGVSLSAFDIYNNTVDPSTGSTYVVRHVSNMSNSLNSFITFFNSGTATNPQVPYDLGPTVHNIKLSMARLVEMVSVQN